MNTDDEDKEKSRPLQHNLPPAILMHHRDHPKHALVTDFHMTVLIHPSNTWAFLNKKLWQNLAD